MWLQWQHPPKCLASHMSAQPLTGKCCRRECPARPPKVPRRQLRHPLGRENPGGGAFQNRGGFGPHLTLERMTQKNFPFASQSKVKLYWKKLKFSFGGNSRNGDSMQYFLVPYMGNNQKATRINFFEEKYTPFLLQYFQLHFLEYLWSPLCPCLFIY